MKTKTLLYIGGAGIALAGALVWAFMPRPLEVEVAAVERGRFERTIDEDAKTRLHDRYVVSTPLAGRLARLTLREGDTVAAGEAVATLTPVLPTLQDERTRREQAARVDTAVAVVHRASTRVERAKVALEQAGVDLRRSEQLARQGFVAPAKLDADRLALRAAQRELDTAVIEYDVATHELEQARAAQTGVAAAGNGRPFVLRSPVAGRVLRVVQPSEATVAAGMPVVELGDTTRLEVVAELLTTDALQATPGTPVRIERWGGDTPLEGRVRLVEPGAFTKVSALGVEEQRVNVRIEITSDAARWRALGDGYRVGVRLVVLALDDALQVPVSAVFPRPDADGPDRMAVFVLESGRARLVPVDLGARNGGAAWIRSGLAAGAKVIVYPPATLEDGARVKERGEKASRF